MTQVDASTQTTPNYLVVPPNRCTAAADRLPWADRLTYRAEPWDIGIRSNTEETSKLVQRLLADVARPELDSPHSNLGVVLQDEPSGGGAEELNLLYNKCKPALRSRNPRRVLEALVAWVDCFRHTYRDDVIAVNAHTVVHDGRCVLFSHGLDRDVRVNRRRLVASGLQVADGPVALIDPVRAEVVVEPPPFVVDTTALDDADRAVDPLDQPVAPGRYPIEAALLWANEPLGTRMSRARLVYALAYTVANRACLGPQQMLDQLALLSERVPAVAGGIRSNDVLPRAAAILTGGPASE